MRTLAASMCGSNLILSHSQAKFHGAQAHSSQEANPELSLGKFTSETEQFGPSLPRPLAEAHFLWTTKLCSVPGSVLGTKAQL